MQKRSQPRLIQQGKAQILLKKKSGTDFCDVSFQGGARS